MPICIFDALTTVPSTKGKRLESNFAKVDFPLPLAPNKAIRSSESILSLMLANIGSPSEYPQLMFSSLIIGDADIRSGSENRNGIVPASSNNAGGRNFSIAFKKQEF